MQDRLNHRHPIKRLAKIVLLTLIDYHRMPDHFLRDTAQHGFGEIHQVMVFGIRLIKLQHGEFRVMAG